MKKLLLLIAIVSFVGIKTNAQTIVGKIENNIGIITINETILKAKWENYLKGTGIRDANIGDFEIQRSADGTYIIVCIDYTLRNNLTSKYGVALSPNGMNLSVGTTTCTCTGCSQGCNPKQSGSTWSCTACTGGGLDCTKSVTAGGGTSLF